MMVQRKDNLLESRKVQQLFPFSVFCLAESLKEFCLVQKRELKLDAFWDVAMEVLSQLDQRLAQKMVQMTDYRLERVKVRMLVAS